MGSFEAVVEICRAVRVVGGRGFVVGGGARDRIVGEGVSEDFDVEVFGVPGSEMIDVLSGRFAVDLVGETFAVVKLRGLDVDVSLPRRDSRAGIGHRGFTVEADPEMTVEEAAVRRDFTINSVYWDPLTDEYVDPCGGVADIGARVLRHTSESFAEDNLRVLRGRSSSPGSGSSRRPRRWSCAGP
ncbi:MAG: hypothetical protein ACRDY7_03650 [Acidimicrobiia bacterium]